MLAVEWTIINYDILLTYIARWEFVSSILDSATYKCPGNHSPASWLASFQKDVGQDKSKPTKGNHLAPWWKVQSLLISNCRQNRHFQTCKDTQGKCNVFVKSRLVLISSRPRSSLWPQGRGVLQGKRCKWWVRCEWWLIRSSTSWKFG